jgi:hypothetical protein
MDTNYLYHYTSAAALVNILNHGFLRATQAWHLADGSECRHAIDTLREIEPCLINNELWTSLETALLSMPRYVVCFSKVRNDAYQWKNYGADGAGACIVFDPKKAHNKRLNSSWELFECEYDQAAQRKRLDELARELNKRGDQAIEEHMGEFWKWNIRFKREEFSRENEIRYVFTAQRPASPSAEQNESPEVEVLRRQSEGQLNKYSHPSNWFDERYRPFEPFGIKDAISEIILGPRFTTTRKYWGHLGDNYSINQI